MSRRPQNIRLPLRNISSNSKSLLGSKMSYSSDSGFSPLTNSPMSNLAFNLSELSTGRTTPRRRLSLSNIDTPPNECGKPSTDRTLSAESGCFSESPPDNSPTLDSMNLARFTSLLHPDIPLEALSAKKKTIAFRRISSQPIPTLRLDSPTDFLESAEDETKDGEDSVLDWQEETESQDSGLGFDHERKTQSMSSIEDLMGSSPSASQSNSASLPSLDDVWDMVSSDFKAPKGKPPKRSRSVMEDRLINEDTCSPIKYSPVKSSLPRPSFASSLFSQPDDSSSNKKEKRTSSLDDGFPELFDIEDLQNEASDQISSLISATLLHRPVVERSEETVPTFLKRRDSNICKRVQFSCADKDGTPSSRPGASKRSLMRSQSLDIRPRPIFKRCEPPEDLSDCVQSNKRWRGEDGMLLVTAPGSDQKKSPCDPSRMLAATRRIHRSHSETEAMIKSAVSRMAMEPDLIGDCSKPYCLPVIKSKHQDLKALSAETVNQLLLHEYDDVVEEFHIIDCRYPYEFDGGHIEKAINIYTKEGVLDKYLKRPITAKDPTKRLILIFHCEFSSERGPGLSRFLRRHDRESNKECYPFLHYPEIYLLEGGYKNFFEQFQDSCEPKLYRTMLDKNHSEDLRKFRAKSKSWAGEKSQRPGLRNLKF